MQNKSSIVLNMNLNASGFARGIKSVIGSVKNMNESMKDATNSASKMSSVMKGIGSTADYTFYPSGKSTRIKVHIQNYRTFILQNYSPPYAITNARHLLAIILLRKIIHLPTLSTLRIHHHLPFWHLQGKIFFQFPVLQAPFRAIFLFADNDVSYRVHHLPLSVFYFFNKFYTVDISRKFHTLHCNR